jgi:hypothetical protein
VEKLDGNGLSKYIKKGDKRGTKINKIDGDLGGTSFRKTLNPKVEQFNISNLDLGTMQWQHVWVFDKHLCKILIVKYVIGQILIVKLITGRIM